MGDIFSALAAGYTSGPPAAAKKPYVNVDPALYQGTWNGTYSTGEKFSFKISNIDGFRAKVTYQSDRGAAQSQDVLINDSQFRVGNSKFFLTKEGQATIKTITTSPSTGQQNLETAPAKLDGYKAPLSDQEKLLADVNDPTNVFISSLGLPAPSGDPTDAFIASLGLPAPSKDPTDSFIASLGLTPPPSDPTDAFIVSLGLKVPPVDKTA